MDIMEVPAEEPLQMQIQPSKLWSLYDLSTNAVMEQFTTLKHDSIFISLPNNMLLDVYFALYDHNKFDILGTEFSNLDLFYRMLKVPCKQVKLLITFQGVIENNVPLADELSNTYVRRVHNELKDPEQKEPLIDIGLTLGTFLTEAGWFGQSEKVFSTCLTICKTLPQIPESWHISLNCCQKLLHVQSLYYMCRASNLTRKYAEDLIYKLTVVGENINLASVFTEFSIHTLSKGNYDEAYIWSLEAIRELTNTSSARVTLETLCQACKACILKRQFDKAEMLISQALSVAQTKFGTTHPRFADTLLVYGFFLLNVDYFKECVKIYQRALKLKKMLYGKCNLQVAIALENMAYAIYVQEYNTGRFMLARKTAEEALQLMENLLPPNHIMLASAKKVKALILEELVLDNFPDTVEENPAELLLEEAETLHLEALRLSRITFGDDNIHTAKHYGNLGRLYQSMQRYEEAEQMHLKAIDIKERVLGHDDYETGISVGQLASLYNYHLGEYHKAESLYLRSIKINVSLYGEAHSGLEYDYRGLMNVYTQVVNFVGLQKYVLRMANWRMLRLKIESQQESEILINVHPRPLADIQSLFD